MPPSEHLPGPIFCPACGGEHNLAECRGNDKGHTPMHRNCPACAERSLRGRKPLSPETSLRDAFTAWLESQSSISKKSGGKVKRLAASSLETYRCYGEAVSLMLGEIPIGELHDGNLVEYEERRAICDGGWKRQCGQNRIRKETDMVRRILKYAKVWTPELEEAYEPLPMLETENQRRLSNEQILMLMEVLQTKNEESRWVLYDSIAALHTCAATNERRLARIKDVLLSQKLFRVGPEQSKNKYRNRFIPLETVEVQMAFEWLLQRAKSLGASEPDHYLFPWRDRRGTYDPSRPMTRWCLAQQFEGIGKLIGDEDLTPYALRHTGMSILAESGAPPDVIQAYGGQVSERMRKHYTTISILAKQKVQVPAWANIPLLFPPKIPPRRANYSVDTFRMTA